MMNEPIMSTLGHHNLKPLLVVIAGPTASGKTGLAIDLALHFHTEILSADSRQCFRELNIGVAKPTPRQMAMVPHHFINSHSITEKVDAAVFESYGLNVLENIFSQRPVAIMAGGTGLYIKALCEGIDEIPAIPAEIREKVRDLYAAGGLNALVEQLHQADPIYYEEGEIKNPHRVMRALEVCLATGKSIRDHQGRSKPNRPFRTVYLGMHLPRPTLHERIGERVDNMVQEGLVEEVKALTPFQHLNALQTVGYKELFEYFDGRTTLEQAIASIKLHTRQYAKRQVTWLKKLEGLHWKDPNDKQGIIDLIGRQLTGTT